MPAHTLIRNLSMKRFLNKLLSVKVLIFLTSVYYFDIGRLGGTEYVSLVLGLLAYREVSKFQFYKYGGD